MKFYQWIAFFGLLVGAAFWAYAKDQDRARETALADAMRPRVEKGTMLTLVLQTSLSSEQSRTGDPVEAILASDVVEEGRLVFAKGTEVYGEVTRSVPSTSSEDKRGRLGFVFNEIEGSGGRIPASMTVVGSGIRESQADRTARTRTQLAGAGVGALLGANMAANEDKNKLKGGVLGGAAGLAVGSLIAHQQGVDVEVPSGSRIRVRVDSTITVP